ncbi:MAG TPA: LptF/LptG family permease, partial [Candidatus Saccharimonadales bacterium]|nr:LptF/LptG family permease [Candidatus Saccharimonadales bacterium]
MKTLHTYLTRQVLATLIMTVAVFTFVLLISNVLKEIIGLLVTGQVGFLTIIAAIGLLIPFVLVFALPMGLLTATLLVFGRFSADNELTAVRASGISLVSLISPVLALSLFLSGLCAWINMEVAPQCRVAYKNLLFAVGMNRTSMFLPEQTYIKDFPNRIVYIESVNGNNLKGILIFNFEGDEKKSYIRASEGKLHIDRTNNTLSVELSDAWLVGTAEGRDKPEAVYSAQLNYTTNSFFGKGAKERVKLSDMSLRQLFAEQRSLEKTLHDPAPLEKMQREELEAKQKILSSQRDEMTLPIKVQIHRQFSFSFACIGFTLLGIPLGIRAHRRETTFGIAIALLLVLVYYSFFILGQSLETRPELFPYLWLWLPNFIFQAMGAVLLWRA